MVNLLNTCKNASEISAEVVSLIYLLTLLTNVRTEANSVDPDQTACRSSLIYVYIVGVASKSF